VRTYSNSRFRCTLFRLGVFTVDASVQPWYRYSLIEVLHILSSDRYILGWAVLYLPVRVRQSPSLALGIYLNQSWFQCHRLVHRCSILDSIAIYWTVLFWAIVPSVVLFISVGLIYGWGWYRMIAVRISYNNSTVFGIDRAIHKSIRGSIRGSRSYVILAVLPWILDSYSHCWDVLIWYKLPWV